MNTRHRFIWCSLLGSFAAQLLCFPAAAVPLTGSLGIHDPSRIHLEDGRYYTFATGFPASPIRMKYSDDFTTWNSAPNGAVFQSIPQWAFDEVTDNGENDIPDNMWAPSVIHFNNEYRMYYSVSTFGSQNSVLGAGHEYDAGLHGPKLCMGRSGDGHRIREKRPPLQRD